MLFTDKFSGSELAMH